MHIEFKPRFIRQYNSLEPALKDEVREKVALFKDSENHKSLRIHKLHGHLKKYLSFSVNYRYRIIFEWLSDDTAGFISIGTHAIYDE